MVRVAVLVSGGGTNLQALIDAQRRGENPYGELSLVISSKQGVYALKRAEEAGIPTAVVHRPDFSNPAEFEAAMLSVLKAYGIEVIVLAGFLSILSDGFISRFRDRILNVHPSLIPAFCGEGYYGLRVHEAALARGVKVTGATVHLVNEICDGGRILLQKPVEVRPDDTPEHLQRRVMEEAEWVLLPQAVAQLCRELEEEYR